MALSSTFCVDLLLLFCRNSLACRLGASTKAIGVCSGRACLCIVMPGCSLLLMPASQIERHVVELAAELEPCFKDIEGVWLISNRFERTIIATRR